MFKGVLWQGRRTLRDIFQPLAVKYLQLSQKASQIFVGGPRRQKILKTLDIIWEKCQIELRHTSDIIDIQIGYIKVVCLV